MFMGIELHRQGFDGIYCFQNTGQETPETIEFLKRAPFPILVLQYRAENPKDRPSFTVETLETMNKTGEPFKQLVKKRQAIPNKRQRFCTQEMKILTLRHYMKSQKIYEWENYLGIRADEPKRVSDITRKYNLRNGKRVRVYPKFPLDDAAVDLKTVGEFWAKQNWDLDMPMLPTGKTICGNCVGCFMKSEAELAITLKRYPTMYATMEEMEKDMGHTFRPDISMTEFRKAVENDIHFDFNIEKEVYCTSELGSCGD